MMLCRFYHLTTDQIQDPVKWRRLNGWLVIFWIGMFAVSIFMGWLNVVAFISILSIYANFATHLGVWAASRAEAIQVEQTGEVAVGNADKIDVH